MPPVIDQCTMPLSVIQIATWHRCERLHIILGSEIHFFQTPFGIKQCRWQLFDFQIPNNANSKAFCQ